MRKGMLKTGLIVGSLVFSLGAQAAGMGGAPRIEGAGASRAAVKDRAPATTGELATPTLNDNPVATNAPVGAGANLNLNTGVSPGSYNGIGTSSGASASVQTNCSAPYAPPGCSATR